MRRLAVDLFSGTGGATEAFRRHGWTVVRVDLDAGAPADVRADVRHLPITGRVDFLWASPPCTEFSDANPRVDRDELRPSTELVAATLAAVSELRPRWWVLENVRGAIPFLGIPAQKIGPWCLWGYFPPIETSDELTRYQKWRNGHSARDRAAVPLALSEALYAAVERHRGVRSLLDLNGPQRWRRRSHGPSESSGETQPDLPRLH